MVRKRAGTNRLQIFLDQREREKRGRQDWTPLMQRSDVYEEPTHATFREVPARGLGPAPIR